jgi:hypothetical protein
LEQKNPIDRQHDAAGHPLYARSYHTTALAGCAWLTDLPASAVAISILPPQARQEDSMMTSVRDSPATPSASMAVGTLRNFKAIAGDPYAVRRALERPKRKAEMVGTKRIGAS